jgi:acyl carrier protein
MDKSAFLKKLQDVLQKDGAINYNDTFADIAEWDSLSMMATVAFLKKNFDLTVDAVRLSKLQKVSELAELANVK